MSSVGQKFDIGRPLLWSPRLVIRRYGVFCSLALLLLIALVVSLAVWIAWRRRWFQRARPQPVAPALEAIRLDDAELTADRLPEEGWMELAARAFQETDSQLAAATTCLNETQMPDDVRGEFAAIAGFITVRQS